MSYFPKPYKGSKNKTKIALVLSNYPAKSCLKNSTGVDTSDFA